MSSPPSATVPSFRACRQAARAVRSAQEGRQAIATIRPRGVAVVRSRAPLALLIRLAALEGRLVWHFPDAFAVLEAPAGDDPSKLGGQRGTKTLRFLDRYWDMLVLAIPALLALALAAGLALVPTTRITALLATLFIILAALSVMVALLARGFAWLHRILIVGRPRDIGEQAVGQLCGLHWSIPLLHASRPSDVADLLAALSRHITGLVHRAGPDAATSRSAEDDQRDVALCLEHGVTTKRARDTVRATAGVTPLPDQPVLVLALGRDRLLREPTISSGMPARAVPLILLAMATMVSINAQFVAEAERADCAPTSCTDRPTSYGDALYWLLNRLLGGDPGGLAPGSLPARSIGLAISIMGLVVIGGVIASALQRAIARVVASGPELARKYNLGVTRASPSARTGNKQTSSPSAVVTPTVLAGGLAVMAFLGYVLGRSQLPHNHHRTAGRLTTDQRTGVRSRP